MTVRSLMTLAAAVLLSLAAGCADEHPAAPGEPAGSAAGHGDQVADPQMVGIPTVGGMQASLQPGETRSSDLPGRYLVVLDPGTDAPAAAAGALAARTGAVATQVYGHALKGFAARMTSAQAAALAAEPGVVAVEPDRTVSLAAQDFPTGVDRLDTELNPVAAIGGAPVDVDVDIAILDTGIDGAHPDLRVGGGVSILGGVVGPDFHDGHGHGTHVAGVAGARDNEFGVVGVAPGARLWAVKVTGDNGLAMLSDIIGGLDWIAARAADIEVVNMSLAGRGWSAAYHGAVAGCVAAGVVVVVAAGNDGGDVFGPDGALGTGDDVVPAAFPEAMTVSAFVDSDGRQGGFGPALPGGPDDALADFSNHSGSAHAANPVMSPGKAIDLALPGAQILSTIPGGGYFAATGTSMAAAHGSGLAGLFIAQFGRPATAAGVFAVRQALIDRAAPQDSPQGLAVLNDPDGNREPCSRAVEPRMFADVGILGLFMPATVVQGQTVFPRVLLSNRGTLDVAVPVTVRMFEVATGRELVVPRAVPGGLPVGTTLGGRAQFPTDANVAPGLYTVIASHDYPDGIGFNDSRSAQIQVLPAARRSLRP